MKQPHFITSMLTALLLIGAGAKIAAAADGLTILSGGAAKSALVDAIAVFEKTAEKSVVADFAPMGALTKKIEAGAKADVLVLSAEVMSEAEKKGWIAPDTIVEIGRVGVGVAVHEAASAPDIATPEAFRASLLAAKSIVMINPATGTSGKHLAQVFATLGIAEALQPKLTLLEGGYVVERVGRGEIEIGLHQITEILPVKGVKLVGPLPAALQKETVYVGAIARSAARADDARRFLALLRTPEMRAAIAAKGFVTTP